MENTNLRTAIAELDQLISHALAVSARHPRHAILRQNIIELKDRRRALVKQLNCNTTETSANTASPIS